MATDLWQTSLKATEQALISGALLPIETELEEIHEGPLRYQIRVLNNLQRKQNDDRLKSAANRSHNPFLPYDPRLYVADIGRKHLCLLNKFNVIDNHLLIVTKAFESQSDLLNLNDFHASVLGLGQIDGLVFFNGGQIAGASQPHKHLQLIPLSAEQLPLSEQLQTFSSDVAINTKLPFDNRGVRVPDNLFDTPVQAAGWLTIHYQKLLNQTKVKLNGTAAFTGYNLLLTREWLMLVPRRKEAVAGISFNALAFCGSILVKNREQRDQLIEIGVSRALHEITE
ncbi:hypothetical protein [uncultured Amphritea sp.]|uniref:ATP adenylyltransferase family protein n=1 Tax=uncultured Amphritea sp. TaxID=981605 RepID=UPI00262625FC|nr:hypothetical protein [uncultured Amphritea sp.]